MLPAGGAEDEQRVRSHVIAAFERNLADRVGHALVGDFPEAFRHCQGVKGLLPRIDSDCEVG